MLRAVNLTKKYDGQLIFKNTNFEANNGDFIGIVGKTGCGKSTLLNILSGYETADNGTVLVNDKDYNGYSLKEINEFRSQRVAFLFQDYNLFEDLTVYENLKLSVKLNKDQFKKIDEYLMKLNLTELKNKKVSKLSGGEKQRIAFLRAIIKDFDILICDEPTGNLDDKNSKLVLDLIKKECKDKIIVMVTHKKSVSNEYFNKKYEYNPQTKIFENVQEKDISIKSKHAEIQRSNFSMIGILMHTLARLKNNLVFNFLLLSVIITFILSFSSYLVLKDGMYRQFQLDKEMKFLPLKEVVVESDLDDIDELRNIERISEVGVRTEVSANFKLLGKDYTTRYYNWAKDDQNTYKINIINEERVIFNFLNQHQVFGNQRDVTLTRFDENDDFLYRDIIVGKYPKPGEVVVDVRFANILLEQIGYTYDRYLDEKITADEIFNLLKGQYLEFYKVGQPFQNQEGQLEQNVDSISFKISGILDSNRAGSYLSKIYCDQDSKDQIINFLKTNANDQYILYKDDATRKTHEKVLNSIDGKYKVNLELMKLYDEAYARVKAMVDYNISLTFAATILFLIGFIILVNFMFSTKKYEIAIYRSLGVNNIVTTFILSFNYLLYVIIGGIIAYLVNSNLVSPMLELDAVFIKLFHEGIVFSSILLIILFFTILLYYVNKYSKKSINSLI